MKIHLNKRGWEIKEVISCEGKGSSIPYGLEGVFHASRMEYLIEFNLEKCIIYQIVELAEDELNGVLRKEKVGKRWGG